MERNLTHLAKREESHRLTIGREKRLRGVLRVRNGSGRLLVERAQIELLRLAGNGGDKDNLRAVGRERERRAGIGIKHAGQGFGEWKG